MYHKNLVVMPEKVYNPQLNLPPFEKGRLGGIYKKHFFYKSPSIPLFQRGKFLKLTPMSFRCHEMNGFTLLEILIALFIFTIVSVIMVKALHTVFLSQSITQTHNEHLAELEVALLELSNDFSQTVNRPTSNEAGSPQGFTGTAHSVTFVHGGYTNPEGTAQHTTLERVRYELNKNQLVRTTWPVLDVTSHTQPRQRVWLSNISELQFSYLDNKNQFQSTWPPNNQNQNNLPKAVRLSLILKKWGKLTQLYIIPGQSFEKPN